MRKPFLDNLRYSVVLLVIFYHVCYLFNSVGVITNVDIPGLPAMDVVEYILYPWFMVTMFVISGVSARYALQKQTDGQFIKIRLIRQLLPSVAIVFILGWTSGWVTGQYADLFGTNGHQMPLLVKYLIWSLSGIGALWYLHELFLADCVLVLMRKLDRSDRLWKIGGKANLPVLCLMMLALWGSARILNTPVVEIYRNGIYLFAFLAGYYVFSHERIQGVLAKAAPGLLAAAGVLAVSYTVTYWGQNYASMTNLQSFLTNAYAWFGTLAAFAAAKRWMDHENGFTRCMAGRSFGFYVLHYPLLALGTWAMDRVLHLPVWSMYLLLPVGIAVIVPPLIALIKRIPVLRTLILGQSG